MIVCGLLGCVTIVVNFTVLWVLWSYPEKQLHSQQLYRFSLGFADLLVGLIVFPSYISTLYLLFVKQRTVKFSNRVSNETGHETAEFEDALPYAYLAVLGLITTVSVAVSIYTLALAGFDRLYAILKPIRYHTGNTTIRTKLMLAFVWLLSVLLGTLPLFAPGLYPYSLISGLIVATTEDDALYEYLVGLGIPFIAVWVSILIVFRTIKKREKTLKSISKRLKNNEKRSKHVYKTLFLMLAAFTMSLLPTLVGMFAQADPQVHEKNPDMFDPDLSAHLSSFELCSAIILTCNSLWNFFIYSAREKEFRKMASSKFRRVQSFFLHFWTKNKLSLAKSMDFLSSPVFNTQLSPVTKTSSKSIDQERNSKSPPIFVFSVPDDNQLYSTHL